MVGWVDLPGTAFGSLIIRCRPLRASSSVSSADPIFDGPLAGFDLPVAPRVGTSSDVVRYLVNDRGDRLTAFVAVHRAVVIGADAGRL